MSSKVQNRIPEALEKLKVELTTWTRDAADIVKEEIKAEGDLPKSGDVHDGGHVSSAPGEPWANLTGGLAESFTKEESALKTTLGSKLARAGLEFGLNIKSRGIHIEARPTIQEAINRAAPTLEKKLQEACRRTQI